MIWMKTRLGNLFGQSKTRSAGVMPSTFRRSGSAIENKTMIFNIVDVQFLSLRLMRAKIDLSYDRKTLEVAECF